MEALISEYNTKFYVSKKSREIIICYARMLAATY